MTRSDRAFVTGVGVMSAIGTSVDEFWDNLLCGRSGVRPITGFSTAGFATSVGAQVDVKTDPSVGRATAFPPRRRRKM